MAWQPDLQQIAAVLGCTRSRAPLVHAITNQITMNDCANVVLSVGAGVVMASSVREVEEVAGLADALVLNTGNPGTDTLQAMRLAGRAANRKGIPVVLDPVGAGSSRSRTALIRQLLQELSISVLRGNASELRVLAGENISSRGVDVSVQDTAWTDMRLRMDEARALAQRTKAIVVMTGKADFITDGDKACLLYNGHEMLSRITGSGCMLSALTGAYCAAQPQRLFEAAVAAAGVMGLAGEQAYYKTHCQQGGTASFRLHLLDAISLMQEDTLQRGLKLEVQ